MSPSNDAAPQLPLRKGTRPPPPVTADWIREGLLTQLDQSNALPETGPWDALVVLGSLRWLLECLVLGTV